MSKVVLLLFAPAQHSCLVEHSALLHFFLVDPLPLRDTRRSGSIRPAAAHHSVLQNSRRMREQPLILFTFCAEVKTYLRLISCGFPGEPWGCSMHESLLSDWQCDMHPVTASKDGYNIVVEQQVGGSSFRKQSISLTPLQGVTSPCAFQTAPPPDGSQT